MLFPVSNGCSRPFRGKASAVGVEGGEARFSMCILCLLVGQKCLQNIKCVRYGGGWGGGVRFLKRVRCQWLSPFAPQPLDSVISRVLSCVHMS